MGTVLVIDPDPHSASIMAVGLTGTGLTVIKADSAEEAKSLMQTINPDLVISETDLPDGSGIDLARSLNEDAHTGRLLWIFITHDKTIDTKIAGLELGAEAYLTKPIYLREFVARVSDTIKKHLEQGKIPGELRSRYEGELSDSLIGKILEAVVDSGKAGTIEVTDGSHKGYFHFSDRQLKGAETDLSKGSEAALHLLLWDCGHFTVTFAEQIEAESASGPPMDTEGLISHAESYRRRWDKLRLSDKHPVFATAREVFETIRKNKDERWSRISNELYPARRSPNDAPRLNEDMSRALHEQFPIDPDIPIDEEDDEPTEELETQQHLVWPFFLALFAAGVVMLVGIWFVIAPADRSANMDEIQTTNRTRQNAPAKKSKKRPAEKVRPAKTEGLREKNVESIIVKPTHKNIHSNSPSRKALAKSGLGSPVADDSWSRARRRGDTAFSRRKLDSAEKAYREAVALDGSRPEGHMGLARVSLERGRPASALKHVADAVAISPSYAEGWLLLGTISHQLGKTAKAKQAYTRYLKLRPESREAAEIRDLLNKL